MGDQDAYAGDAVHGLKPIGWVVRRPNGELDLDVDGIDIAREPTFAEREALAETIPGATFVQVYGVTQVEVSEEDAYVIEQLGRLLAQISVTLNGPEPANGRWSYHDLPAKVQEVVQERDERARMLRFERVRNRARRDRQAARIRDLQVALTAALAQPRDPQDGAA